MEREKLITVIVPVYNVQKYLDRCLLSITKQTYRNIEVILIDDGSRDESSQICDKWSANDSRVKVYHTLNRGGGAARNLGLNHANGEYISFVDSDDYISEYMLECLEEKISEGYDIAECDYIKVEGEEVAFGGRSTSYDVMKCSAEDALRYNIRDEVFRQIIWNKLYRRDVIGKIRFPEGTQIDDEYWTYKVIGNAKKLIRIEGKFYAYRQHNESVMHKSDAMKKMQTLMARVEKRDYVEQRFPRLLDECTFCLWMGCMYQGQITIKEKNKIDIKKTFEYIKEIIEKYPIQNYACIPLKQKVWIDLFGMSAMFTCKLRNCLGIGF